MPSPPANRTFIYGEGNCIKGLGDIALSRSEHTAAREHYEQALPVFRQVGDLHGEAGCVSGLGDIALARSDQVEARRRYQEAVALYQRVEARYSIGLTHRRLARIAETDSDRTRHVQAAREAWLKIDRSDLIKQLDDEFGAASAANA